MDNQKKVFAARALGAGAILLGLAVCGIGLALLPARQAMAGHTGDAGPAAGAATEPWSDAQTVQPAELSKEVSVAQNRPVVVCAGFRVLYEGAHVPGAVYHGPASKPEGLADLKKWAQGIPRSANLVVYCGCCPFSRCPNIRPAFEALRAMGFQHLRVLLLPDNFAKDWVVPGYAYDKGK